MSMLVMYKVVDKCVFVFCSLDRVWYIENSPFSSRCPYFLGQGFYLLIIPLLICPSVVKVSV